MVAPGSLIFSMGRPESRRKTTSRQISARERLISSLLKEESWPYLTWDHSKSPSGLPKNNIDRTCRDIKQQFSFVVACCV